MKRVSKYLKAGKRSNKWKVIKERSNLELRRNFPSERGKVMPK